MNTYDKIVIVGATSAIARHCARLWLEASPRELILAGRNQESLLRLADDFTVRSPTTSISTQKMDFLDPQAISQFVDDCTRSGYPDLIFIAHGTLPDQQACQNDLQALESCILVNALSPALFAEAFASRHEGTRQARLCVIGSVAGDRGRKSNYAYGASKGLLERFIQGMQHRFAKSSLLPILVKPGPTESPMTSHLNGGKLQLASPASVAKVITRGIDKGRKVIYAPGKWWLIMMVIRHLPAVIFNRMDI